VSQTTEALLPRLLAGMVPGRALSLEEHLALHGAPPVGRRALEVSQLVALLEQSALRGRGGSGFPSAAKVIAVARVRSRAVVVVNGVEAEPVSEKDRALLGHSPHLVLDGADIVADALGAREVIVCTPANSEWVGAAVSLALAERGERGAPASARLVRVGDGYVAGEETAVVNLLNGGPSLPTFRPPYPFERGVGRRPTLVNNAETLAHIALIARHGADWYREVGLPEQPGSALVTVTGAVQAPGVYEIEYGTPLSYLIRDAGGQMSDLRALLVGGCAGTWMGAPAAATLTACDESLRQALASLGPGVIIALPQERCGVAETVALAGYLAQASAHQCGPCEYGLAAIARTLAAIANGTADRDARSRLERWLGDVHRRGACRHPDGAVRMIISALATFNEEFTEHARRGPCPACRHGAHAFSLGRHAASAMPLSA